VTNSHHSQCRALARVSIQIAKKQCKMNTYGHNTIRLFVSLTTSTNLTQETKEQKMMTRKDYVTTANILNSYAKSIRPEIWVDLVEDFVEMFQNDNPNFDTERFIQAVIKK
jgi:hypothetical protein